MNSLLTCPQTLCCFIYLHRGSSFVSTLLLASASFLATPFRAQCRHHILRKLHKDSGEGGACKAPPLGTFCRLLHPVCLNPQGFWPSRSLGYYSHLMTPGPNTVFYRDKNAKQKILSKGHCVHAEGCHSCNLRCLLISVWSYVH